MNSYDAGTSTLDTKVGLVRRSQNRRLMNGTNPEGTYYLPVQDEYSPVCTAIGYNGFSTGPCAKR